MCSRRVAQRLHVLHAMDTFAPSTTRSLLRNQTGSSSVGYLFLALFIGLASVGALSSFGDASTVAFVGQSQSSPSLNASMAAATDPGPPAAAPVEETDPGSDATLPETASTNSAGSSADSPAGTPVGALQEDGSFVTPDGAKVGQINEDGILVLADGTTVGQMLPDGSIVGPDGVAIGVVDGKGTVYALGEEQAQPQSEMVPGSQVAKNDRVTEPDAEPASEGVATWAKVVGGVGLVAGGIALAVAASVPAVIAAGVAAVAWGGYSLYHAIWGGDDGAKTEEAKVAEKPAENEQDPATNEQDSATNEQDPAADQQAPVEQSTDEALFTLETLGLTDKDLVESPYDAQLGTMSSSPEMYVLEQLGKDIDYDNMAMSGQRMLSFVWEDGSKGNLTIDTQMVANDGTSYIGEFLLTDETGKPLEGGSVPVQVSTSKDFSSVTIEHTALDKAGKPSKKELLLRVDVEKKDGRGTYVTTFADGKTHRYEESFELGQGYEENAGKFAANQLAYLIAQSAKPRTKVASMAVGQEVTRVDTTVDGKPKRLLVTRSDVKTSILAVDADKSRVSEWLFEVTNKTDGEGYPLARLQNLRVAKLPKREATE